MDGIRLVPRARRAHSEPDGDTGKQRAAGGLDVCATRGIDLKWRSLQQGGSQQARIGSARAPWEGPINEDTDAQNKAGRTWESFNRGLVYLNKPV